MGFGDKPTASVNIPTDVLTPIIEAKITEALVAALGGQRQILSQAVTTVLNQRVDENGRPSSYRNAVTYIQYLLDSTLKEAAQKALREAMADQEKIIKAQIVKELQKTNSPLIKQLIAALTTGVLNVTQDSWKLRINLVVE